jgi:large subunit ribosomal protein L7e
MTTDAKNSSLPLVPEILLKKRHDLDESKARRAARIVNNDNNNKRFSKTGKFYVKKPERFLAQALSRKNHEIRYLRVMKKGMQKRASKKSEIAVKEVEESNGDVSEVTYQKNSIGAKMVFVIRIRDNNGLPQKVKIALWKLNLRSVYDGVFVRYNQEMKALLYLVEPWVVYGPPSTGVISDLITRRGHGRVAKQRIPISNNTIIETELGPSSGILCVEDLVHVLSQADSNDFDAATSFLWPFRLKAPKTRFETQKLNDKEGRIYGDCGEEMDAIVQQML